MKTHQALLLVVMITAVTVISARADKLDEYKKAKGQKNCASIPDSDRQGDCRTAQGDVKDYCDKASCQGLSFKDRLNILKGKQEEVSRLERDIRELDSKISSAKEDDKKRFEYDRDGKRKDLEGKQREVESGEKEINDIKIQIAGKTELANRCRHARLEVQKVFLRAEKDAESDGQSNEEIKKIATEDLIPHWKEEGIKHTDAIIDTQKALDECSSRAEGRN
jgi:hypothetical protein